MCCRVWFSFPLLMKGQGDCHLVSIPGQLAQILIWRPQMRGSERKGDRHCQDEGMSGPDWVLCVRAYVCVCVCVCVYVNESEWVWADVCNAKIKKMTFTITTKHKQNTNYCSETVQVSPSAGNTLLCQRCRMELEQQKPIELLGNLTHSPLALPPYPRVCEPVQCRSSYPAICTWTRMFIH